MAKLLADAALDLALNLVKNNCNLMVACSQQPTTYTQAVSTYALASVAMTTGNYTLGDGDVDGRKLTTAAKNTVAVTASGTITHVALVDTTNSILYVVTTTTSQAVTAGNTIDFPAWALALADVFLAEGVGPLKVSTTNSRYLTDGAGRAKVLAGSNYWWLWSDGGYTDPPPAFDFDAYITFAVAHGYNVIHGHAWENSKHTVNSQTWYISPLYYARTGPGNALDGKPKFDLNTFDSTYFTRLRERVIKAGQRGLYVVYPIWDSFSIKDRYVVSNVYANHPYNASNNINSVNADPTSQGNGADIETLNISAITTRQEALVAHLIDTLNDLDNIIWEICIEPDGSYSRAGHDSFEWVNHFVNYIRTYEAGKPKQHPVLNSAFWPNNDNATLLASNAEAVSLNPVVNSDGTKVVMFDTDHVDWPNGSADEFWQWFMAGAGGLFFMDQSYDNHVYDDYVFSGTTGGSYSANDNARNNLGWIISYAARIDLNHMVPQNGGTSPCNSGYCLYGNSQYLCYKPTAASFTIDLTGESGTFTVERFKLADGTTSNTTTTGGAVRTIALPGGWTGGWAAYIYK